MSATAAEGKLVFESNWISKVDFNFHDNRLNKIEKVETSQGSLFRLLWKGEKIENDKEPSMPLTLKDAHNEIQETELKIHSQLTNNYKQPFAFLMAHNKIGDISKKKQRDILKSLSGSFRVKALEISLDEAGFEDHSKYLPYITIQCFLIDHGDQAPIEAALKSALYVPVKDKKTDRENYHLKKHGVLVSLRT